ncbi:MAG: YceG family protein [Ruminococcus sp.]|jgi:hypothetical protein|nr:YceG family protein [Ruminococcus sp.]
MKFEGFSTPENTERTPIIYLETAAEAIPTDVLKLKSERRTASDNYSLETEKLKVYFASLIGVPPANDTDDYYVYRNMLYTLRENLIKSPKCLIYIENGMRAPTDDEKAVFTDIPHTGRTEILEAMISLVRIDGDTLREGYAKTALKAVSKDISDDLLYDFCVKIITWLSRCTRSEHYVKSCSEIPLLMFYGRITSDEMRFLHFSSMLGFDVLYICEDRQYEKLVNEYNPELRLQLFTLPLSNTISPYPDKLLKVKVVTDAYRASKQLDQYLYSSDTFFRDFQFPKITALTLKTTIDEIDVLWHEQSKFRSGFKVEGDRAIVPNIFAKISGVRGDLDSYFDGIKYKLSPMSIITRNSPAYKRDIDSHQLKIYRNYINGEQIITEKLKNSSLNKFQYLSENIQNTIFEKMQEAADSGYLKLDFSETLPQIIHVGLNLDKNILHLYQKFDFTKDIPKFIIIDTIEDTFSKVECIQLVLLNLLGFDILIYTPTGYRNLETFVDDSAFESYIQGEYKYKVSLPRFKIPNKIPEPKPKGLFDRLFR